MSDPVGGREAEIERLRDALQRIADGEVDGVGDYSECVQLYAQRTLDAVRSSGSAQTRDWRCEWNEVASTGSIGQMTMVGDALVDEVERLRSSGSAAQNQERWTIHVCEKCGKPHQGTSRTSCIVEFDSAGDELAATRMVEVVPARSPQDEDHET